MVSLLAGTDHAWAQSVVDDCPSIREGCRPPFWARNGHVQAALSLLLDDRASSLEWDEEERIVLSDGGTVSLQWAGLAEPEDIPTLVCLHTICGSGHGLRRLIRSMRERLGWAVVACNRRGHSGLPLTAPRINTMGFVDDLDAQLDRILARRPKAPLYAVGVSAGSGLLVRYLGEKGDSSRFSAGVAVCPAYDIPEGLRAAHPWYDLYLARRMSRFFLEEHRDAFEGIADRMACRSARTMVEFQERIYPFAGFESREAYEGSSDPMRVVRNVQTPTLVLNSEDDPVCSVLNVHRHRDSMRQLPRVLTVLTRFGGHCGFFEAVDPRGSWSDRAIAEYLSAIHGRRSEAALDSGEAGR